MFDEKTRRISLKRGKKRGVLPERISLIPSGPIGSATIKDAIFRVAESVCQNEQNYRAVRSLLARTSPRLSGGSTLSDMIGDPLQRTVATVQALDSSYLLIQGPPGAGKTFTSARAIVSLLAGKKRVGVASNSHKAINKLLEEIEAVASSEGLSFKGIKKSSKKSQFFRGTSIGNTTDNKDVTGHQLIAGTAWLFSREEMDGALDYLFIDEAGQVSLANVVGMGTSSRNIVLVGDQAQLGQPIKGAHPGEFGCSALEYVLRDHATVPEEMGILFAGNPADASRRLPIHIRRVLRRPSRCGT